MYLNRIIKGNKKKNNEKFKTTTMQYKNQRKNNEKYKKKNTKY